MPISAKKFNTFTFNHSAQPDELYDIKTSAEIKSAFDSRSEQVRVAFNALIDNLLSVANGDDGTHNIGIQPIEGLPGATLYDVIISIRDALNNVSMGGIPNNSLTDAKLGTDIKVGSLAALSGSFTGTNRTNVVNALNMLMTASNNQTTVSAGKIDTFQAVTTAQPNKLLYLNAFGKFDADSSSVNGKTATGVLNTTEKTNLVGAINEVLVALNNFISTNAVTPVANSMVMRDAAGNIQATQFQSTVAAGTPPMTVTSPTVVANLNADQVDGLNAADLAKTVQEALHSVTFQNGWVNSGGADAPAQYYIDTMGIVHIQGLIKNGTIGTVAFTLPAGYRPALSQGFCCMSSGATAAYVRVVNDGTVSIVTGNNAWVTLNGITFRAGY